MLKCAKKSESLQNLESLLLGAREKKNARFAPFHRNVAKKKVVAARGGCGGFQLFNVTHQHSFEERPAPRVASSTKSRWSNRS